MALRGTWFGEVRGCPVRKRLEQGMSLQEGLRARGRTRRQAAMGVHWRLQVPSSLRTPSLLLTNLPPSLGSVKKIDYFPLQLTSGRRSHH